MYEFRQVNVDKESINACSVLLQKVFPNTSKFTEAFLKWEYAENPAGKIVGFNAFFEKKLVAHYVTQPVVVNLFGKETKGLLSLNTATHPDHQGNKLFTLLADLTYKFAIDNGYEFVYGVANANSIHGFINKLGFQFVCPLETKIGLGKIITAKKKKEICFQKIWTRELIEWRLKNPEIKYEISGQQILAPSGQFGIKAIMGTLDEQILKDIPFSHISSINPLKLYVGLDNRMIWKKSLFIDVPKKLKSSPLNLIFKDLTGKERILDKDNLKIQILDFDGF